MPIMNSPKIVNLIGFALIGLGIGIIAPSLYFFLTGLAKEPKSAKVTPSITNVAPTNQPSVLAENPHQETKEIRIVLYNGTKASGLTKTAEKLLKEKISNIEILKSDNASTADYQESLIVNLNNISEKVIEEIANLLGTQVSPLPAGENKPENSDLLIILGQDFINH